MATRKRTLAKIQATVDAGNDSAARLYRVLDLADAVSPDETEQQKAIAKLIATTPKDDPIYTILVERQESLTDTGDVDIYDAFREACRVVGISEAKGMAKCIGKLAGDEVSSEWKKAESPDFTHLIQNGDDKAEIEEVESDEVEIDE